MGFWSGLIGRHSPQPGVAPVSAGQLKANLLALNRPTAPYIIRECTADDPENADLVAEWRMREPAWYAAFGTVNLSHSFQVFMRLLPDRNEVQSIDWTWDVTWSGGVPSFSLSKTGERGLQWEYKTGVRPFYETTPSGERIAYRFSSSELKKPLHDTVTRSGWSWRSRFAGRLPHGSHAEALRALQPPNPRKQWLRAALAFLIVFAMTFQVLSRIFWLRDSGLSIGGGSAALTAAPPVLAAVVALAVARVVFVKMNR